MMSNAMEQKSFTTQTAVKKWGNSQGLRLSKAPFKPTPRKR